MRRIFDSTSLVHSVLLSFPDLLILPSSVESLILLHFSQFFFRRRSSSQNPYGIRNIDLKTGCTLQYQAVFRTPLSLDKLCIMFHSASDCIFLVFVAIVPSLYVFIACIGWMIPYFSPMIYQEKFIVIQTILNMYLHEEIRKLLSTLYNQMTLQYKTLFITDKLLFVSWYCK